MVTGAGNLSVILAPPINARQSNILTNRPTAFSECSVLIPQVRFGRLIADVSNEYMNHAMMTLLCIWKKWIIKKYATTSIRLIVNGQVQEQGYKTHKQILMLQLVFFFIKMNLFLAVEAIWAADWEGEDDEVLGVVGGSYLRVVDLLSLEPHEQLNDQVWNYNLAFNCLFCKIYDCFQLDEEQHQLYNGHSSNRVHSISG